MKAISIRQPWASLIANGEKTIECRSWKTNYRGPLVLCASKGDMECEDGLVIPGGVALAVIDLLDVKSMTKADLKGAMMDDFEPEEVEDVLRGYAWHIKLQTPILPVPVKGKLNLFEVDIPLEALPSEYEDHLAYLYLTQGMTPPKA